MNFRNWCVGTAVVAMAASMAAQASAQRTSDGFGVTEWEAWGFASKDFWVRVAGDQGRSEWAGGSGMVAVADPDEWDDTNDVGIPDSPDNYGTLNSQLKTPPINVAAYGGQTGVLSFNSSWRPEFDDYANQSASLEVSFDGGSSVELFRWNANVADSDPGEDDVVAGGRRQNTLGVGHGVDDSGRVDPADPLSALKNPAVDEVVARDVAIPTGANSMTAFFNFFDGTNDWWWAIDNIRFDVGATNVFLEDFESLSEIAKPVNGGGQIDEDWRSAFPATPPGTVLFNNTPTYTQNPPTGWEITPDYTGPSGSWANNNGQVVSVPGLNGAAPVPAVPEPSASALAALALAGVALRRRQA